MAGGDPKRPWYRHPLPWIYLFFCLWPWLL